VKIEEFRPEHSTAFEALNRSWLTSHGLLEEVDEPHLTDPVGTIAGAGGQIFVAIDNDDVIGTCGIAPHGPGEYEMLKLAVATSAQGRGIGRQLVDSCLDFARRQGAQRVTLLSSSLLRPAVRLYERAGFRHAPIPETNPYVTADVYMVLDIAP
jgi:putative acetyltransferase